MTAVAKIPPPAARRFMRQALLLDTPAPDIATALAHHGYCQIDPINVCGRMHDLILRNRVAGYPEGGLMRHLHGSGTPLSAKDRRAFEHHLPSTHTLVALTLDAWPHLLAAMHRRTRRTGAWSGRLTPREKELANRILAEIASRGPLCSEDIEDERRSRQMIWGSFSLAKSTLQKLFFHGRVLIAKRGENNRRYYDLPERVLPPAIVSLTEPDAEATARWETLLKLRQRRLVMLKRAELPLVEDLVQPVHVDGCPTLHCLRSDGPRLEACRSDAPLHSSELKPSLTLLAPLDPMIYDRRVTTALWGFDYTWEVYTPPAKRRRGYYALPVLAGHELVGHVDPKADREKRRLVVVSRSLRRGHKATPAVQALARWLGLK